MAWGTGWAAGWEGAAPVTGASPASNKTAWSGWGAGWGGWGGLFTVLPAIPTGNLLSARQLATMRKTVALTLQTPCTVLRRGDADDGMGGQVETWQTLSAPPCRVVADTMDSEIVQGDKVRAERLAIISLPWDTDAGPADRLSVNGFTYEIRNTNRGLTDQIKLVAQCALLE